MIVSIKKDDNVLDYDLSKIKDDEARRISTRRQRRKEKIITARLQLGLRF